VRFRPAFFRPVLFGALLAVLLIATASARADDAARDELERVAADAEAPPVVRADALVTLAEQDEEAFAFARALQRYQAARALDPHGRRAPRAEARAEALTARAEGAFEPLEALERVRRSPAHASDPAAIDALVAAAETFPEGLVRVEAWVLAAEAYAHRLGRPDDALVLLARITSDPHADPVLVKQAFHDRVELHAAKGDVGGAREAARQSGAPELERMVARLVRRGYVRHGAMFVLLVMVGLAGRAVIAGGRRRVRAALRTVAAVALGFAAWIALLGGALAAAYEGTSPRPFFALGAALIPILFVARAWSAAGSSTLAARGGRALISASSTFATAFLVLDWIDASVLTKVGL
jgi:hypothetical protein